MKGELCQQWQSLRSPEEGPPNGILAKHCTGLTPRQQLPVNWTISSFPAPFHTERLILHWWKSRMHLFLILVVYSQHQSQKCNSKVSLSAHVRMLLFPVFCESVGRKLKAPCTQVAKFSFARLLWFTGEWVTAEQSFFGGRPPFFEEEHPGALSSSSCCYSLSEAFIKICRAYSSSYSSTDLV